MYYYIIAYRLQYDGAIVPAEALQYCCAIQHYRYNGRYQL